MSRHDRDRLGDIVDALDRCLRYRDYLGSADSAVSDMALDAVLRNLAVAGEAAKSVSEQTRAGFESVPWHSIVGLRSVVVHEYFRIDVTIVIDIIDSEIKPLVEVIRAHLEADPADFAEQATAATHDDES